MGLIEINMIPQLRHNNYYTNIQWAMQVLSKYRVNRHYNPTLLQRKKKENWRVLDHRFLPPMYPTSQIWYSVLLLDEWYFISEMLREPSYVTIFLTSTEPDKIVNMSCPISIPVELYVRRWVFQVTTPRNQTPSRTYRKCWLSYCE